MYSPSCGRREKEKFSATVITSPARTDFTVTDGIWGFEVQANNTNIPKNIDKRSAFFIFPP